MFSPCGRAGETDLTEGNKANGEDREKYFHFGLWEKVCSDRMALSLGIGLSGLLFQYDCDDDFVELMASLLSSGKALGRRFNSARFPAAKAIGTHRERWPPAIG